MNDQSQAAADTDNLMIDTLRACGFFVRAGDPLIGQRPQVVGSIDNAIAFFKLAIAGADASATTEFAPYLKEGETPLQRLQREIKDSETLAAMLAAERSKTAQHGASDLDTLREAKEQLRRITVAVTGSSSPCFDEVIHCIDLLVEIDTELFCKAYMEQHNNKDQAA